MCLVAPRSAWAVITIDTVPVGNAGNGDDPADGDQFITDGIQNFGAVPYVYNIGTTEVTNAQ
jgi:sulfatase modifying factor 1